MVLSPILSPYNGTAAQRRPRPKNPYLAYRLEIVNGINGETLLPLPKFFDGSWEQSINQPSTLSFKYPADDYASEWLVFPNLIALLDDTGEVLEKFSIREVSTSRDSDGIYFEVQCESLLSLLNNHVIISYVLNDINQKTIQEIIQEWLDTYQAGTAKVHFGAIDQSVGLLYRKPSIQGSRILGAINDLRDTAMGFIYVSPKGFFYWRDVNHYGEAKGQQLRYRKNLVGITRQVNTQNLITRGYFYGEGRTSDDRITLIDAGEETEYLDSHTNDYGIISEVFINKDIKDPDTLLLWAQSKMKEMSTPEISYQVDCIDLSKSGSSLDYSFEYITLGSQVRVIDEPLHIEAETTVVGITRSLDNPLDVQLELSTRAKNISDFLAELLKGQRVLENADTAPKPSDATPSSIGSTGSAGFSDDYSRADHAHDLDAEGLADDLASLMGSSSDPLPVALTAAPGEVNELSRSDHIHPIWPHTGRVFIVSEFADLLDTIDGVTIQDGDIGFIEDKKWFYGRRDDAWRILHAFSDANVFPSNVGEQNGDLYYDTTNNRLWRFHQNEWRITPYWQQTVQPEATDGAKNGDLWYNGGLLEGRLYYRHGTWLNLSHYEEI